MVRSTDLASERDDDGTDEEAEEDNWNSLASRESKGHHRAHS